MKLLIGFMFLACFSLALTAPYNLLREENKSSVMSKSAPDTLIINREKKRFEQLCKKLDSQLDITKKKSIKGVRIPKTHDSSWQSLTPIKRDTIQISEDSSCVCQEMVY